MHLLYEKAYCFLHVGGTSLSKTDVIIASRLFWPLARHLPAPPGNSRAMPRWRNQKSVAWP